MTDCSSDKKCRIVFFASMAVNIFLVALMLGHWSAPLMPPPPPMVGPGGFGPPPAFGPGDIFRPEEMNADEARMRKDFEKMESLRKAFAAQLEAGPVNKENVLKHFAAMDEIMDGVQKEVRERAAEKISSMSESERKNFAHMLTSREKEHFRENRFGPPDRR
jgi:hypothetical protein